jgi:hypothetical protein
MLWWILFLILIIVVFGFGFIVRTLLWIGIALFAVWLIALLIGAFRRR